MSLALVPISRPAAAKGGTPLPLGALRPEHTPEGGLKYWLALGAASVLGCNAGDLFASAFDLAGGLPLLAAGLGATLLAARAVRRPTQAFYWTAILLIRTAATDIADVVARQAFGGWVFAALAAALLASALRSPARRPGADDLPQVDAGYWLRMLAAGTLGTALGDMASYASGLGLAGASLALGGVVAALLAARASGLTASTLSFWTTVTAIRAAGTSLGDLSADSLGLVHSAFIWALTLACIVFFKTRPRRRRIGAGLAAA